MKKLQAIFLFLPFLLFASNEKEVNTFKSGYILENLMLKPDFFSPGRISVNKNWDVFVASSFLFWQAIPLGVDIAALQKNFPSENLSTTTEFEWKLPFKPAFKIRLGVNARDNWVLFLDFLRYEVRQKTDAFANLDQDEVLVPAGWVGAPAIGTPYNAACTLHIKYTEFVLALGRPLYLGTRFIFFPHFGLTFDFVSEKAVTSLNRTFDVILQQGGPSKSHNLYTCSAVGPRVAFELKYLLGAGIRMEGKGGVNLVFRKGELRTRRWVILDGAMIRLLDYNDEALTLIRPSLDLGLGLGWGRYLNSEKQHIDLYAGYEFKVLWDQQTIGAEESNGTFKQLITLNPQSLFFHGLTITTRFDF